MDKLARTCRWGNPAGAAQREKAARQGVSRIPKDSPRAAQVTKHSLADETVGATSSAAHFM